MNRFLVAACLILLTACGVGSGIGGPPSAQSVAQNSADFPGMHQCQQSGSYDSYLKAEQTKNPTQYQSDKKNWDDLKAAGANDSYLAIYAANTADCSEPSFTNLSGKVAYVFAIRYKDTPAAQASYKSELGQFHVSDQDVSQIKAIGGTAQQGSATGLGTNSIVVSVNAAGVSVSIAVWQSKEFLVVLLADGIAVSVVSAATKNINGRIH